MLYAVICKDREGGLPVRVATRDAHLAHIHDSGIVHMAGPLLVDGEMRGSLVIVEAPDLATAKAWSAGDPYLAAGLFDSVEVIEWKKVVG